MATIAAPPVNLVSVKFSHLWSLDDGDPCKMHTPLVSSHAICERGAHREKPSQMMCSEYANAGSNQPIRNIFCLLEWNWLHRPKGSILQRCYWQKMAHAWQKPQHQTNYHFSEYTVLIAFHQMDFSRANQIETLSTSPHTNLFIARPLWREQGKTTSPRPFTFHKYSSWELSRAIIIKIVSFTLHES